MSSAVRATIIIPTRNRAKSLSRCLDALARLESSEAFEVVIVDNGSVDETAEICREFQRRASFKVGYVFEPRQGIAVSRNSGLAVATGLIIVMTDDDVLVTPNWLRKILATFEEHPGVDFIGGQVLPARVGLQPIGFIIDPHAKPVDRSSELWSLMGANMAIRRSALNRVGYFDERLGAGQRFAGAEESDIIYRLLKAGGRGWYAPDVVVYHDHGRCQAEEATRLMRSYGRGYAGFLAKWLWRSDLTAVRIMYWTVVGLFRVGFFESEKEPSAAARARARLAGFFGALVPALLELRGMSEGERQISSPNSEVLAFARPAPPQP